MTPTQPAIRSRKPNPPLHHPASIIHHPSHQPPSHDGGSVIILVVVVLALMTILGMAYLQVVRVDRRATAQISDRNIDGVVAATVSYIQTVLAHDLHAGTANFHLPANQSEGYDFPWTNSNNWTVLLSSGSTATAKGGQSDDTWLASCDLDFTTPTVPLWKHLTNLNGIFLLLPKPSHLTAKAPAEHVVINSTSSWWVWDTNARVSLSGGTGLTQDQPTWYPAGVDTDEDGFVDARWTWAVIRQIGNTQYIAAYRIIDNSAMVNVNTAMSHVTGAAVWATYPDGPCWWELPTELGLGHLMASLSGATYLGELNTSIAYRMGAAGTYNPTPVSSADNFNRYNYWQRAGALRDDLVVTGLPYRKYGAYDERELRQGNGLNNIDDEQPIENATTGMASFLRTAATENTYTDVNLAAYGGTNGSLQSFFEVEPRKQLTTMSGTNLWSVALPGETGVVYKQDLNYLASTNPAGLSAQIKRVLDGGTSGGVAYPIPGHYTAAGIDDTQKLADQMAACIADYRDTDNRLSAVNGRYGMEALPFIAEVYVQRPYVATVDTSGATNDTVTWAALGQAGYAIEIRNPFPRRIDGLDRVHLFVNGSEWGTSLQGLSGQTSIPAYGVLVLYRNSSGASNDNVSGLISGTPTTVAITNAWPGSTGVVNVELRAEDQTTSSVLGWGYHRAASVGTPDPVVQSYAKGAVLLSGGAVQYRQHASVGNGTGMNPLTVRPSDFSLNDQGLSNVASLPYDSTWERLGQADKTGGGVGFNGGVANRIADSTLQQVYIGDKGRIRHTGELAHMAMLGPSSSATFADAWNAQSDVTRFMLDFGSATKLGTGSLGVTHAAAMIERFTTLSPADDGIDNDGSGAADGSTGGVPNELFVPGTLNLNTAPRTLLSMALPIADSTVKSNVVSAIVALRDNPAARGTGLKGIAHLGELYEVLKNELVTTHNGESGTISAIVSDYLDTDGPDRTAGTADDGTDGIPNDRKEAALPTRWLAQVGSTRSDIFTAYVVIRGYQADDFRTSPLEQAKFLAVFDRSNVRSAADQPRLVVMYRTE